MNESVNPANDKIRYLGDVQRLELKPGDKVVLQIDQPITDDMACRIRDTMKRYCPDNEVIVLSDGIKIGVLAAA